MSLLPSWSKLSAGWAAETQLQKSCPGESWGSLPTLGQQGRIREFKYFIYTLLDSGRIVLSGSTQELTLALLSSQVAHHRVTLQVSPELL